MGRRTTLLVIACVLALAAALLSAVGLWARTAAEAELAARGDGILKLYVSNLAGRLSRFEALPQLLAQMPELRGALVRPDDPEALAAANEHLAMEAEFTGALDIYVMDRNGLTIAASNWRTEYSFVGRNFAFRPYFQQAMAGRTGRYFALGNTSLQRGYYFAGPVTMGDEIAGVVVVKMDPAEIETVWEDLEDRIVVTDPHGVIFISSDPAWLYHALRPLGAAEREAIADSLRYPGIRVTELPLVERPSDQPDATLLTLRERDSRRGGTSSSGESATGLPFFSLPEGTRRFLHQSAHMASAGWTVHILSDLRPLDQQVVKQVSLVAALLALVIAIAAWVRLRLQSYRASMEAERRTAAILAAKEEAVRRANDQLEQRVRLRTAELEQAHRRLTDEMEERERVQADLRQTQDNLVHAGRLAAIGQLAAGVTHELNQPLTAMRAYADNARILLARNRLGEVEQNLARIGDLIDRLADISGRLKRFATRTRPESGPVRLDDVLRTSIELVQVGTRLPDLEILNAAAGTDLLVLGERVRLEQVFINLLRNAVEALADQPRRRITIDLFADETWVAVAVTDTGPGLSAEGLAHLAVPFFSSKRPGEGIGLGLSISNGIVHDFGGSLTAENRHDGGAVFTVRLRRATGAAAPGPSLAPAETAAADHHA